MPTLLLNHEPVNSNYSPTKTSNLILNIDVCPSNGETYVSYEDCKRIIAGKFTSITKYTNYVIEHNLHLKGLPKYPSVSYRDQYKGVEDFLGGSASEQAILSSKHSRGKRKIRKPKPVENDFVKYRIVNSVKSNSSKSNEIDMIMVCKYLADRKMLDVLNVISNHKNLNFSDARNITSFLIDLYKG